MTAPREPSMEDILASIKKVIAEEKELRAAIPPGPSGDDDLGPDPDDDVLELDQPMDVAPPAPQAPAEPPPETTPEPAAEPPAQPEAGPPADLGPPLVAEEVADAGRARLAELTSVAASAPPPQPATNPLDEIVRDMLRPALKAWLDEHLPRIVDEHVKREISRITGKPL
jgi:cell pole-organizing protein PopZ